MESLLLITVYTCGSQQQVQDLLVSSSSSGTCWAHALLMNVSTFLVQTSKWNHGLRSRPSVDFVKFASWQQEKGASRKHIAEKFSSQESALLQNPNHDGFGLEH